MKGGIAGRFAPASFGTAVWVIASTALTSAIMEEPALEEAAVLGASHKANHISQPRMPAPTRIAARHILALQLTSPVSKIFSDKAMPFAIFSLRQSPQPPRLKVPTP